MPTPAPTADSHDSAVEFMRLITAAQRRLFAFICSLMGSSREADDVLQETNLVLWQKASEYDPSRDFATWACTIARFKVMEHRKRTARDRLLLDDELIGRVADKMVRMSDKFEERWQALGHCMERLPAHHRKLLSRRYQLGEPLAALAADLGRSRHAVVSMLFRIRATLSECVERAVRVGGVS